MKPAEEIADLTLKIYDSAMTPHEWSGTLAAIARCVGADACGLSFAAFDLWRGEPPLAFGLPARDVTAYLPYHVADPIWSRSLRLQLVGRVHEILPARALEQTRIYQEWLRPRGLRHILHVLLWRDPPERSGLLLARANSRRAFSQTSHRILAQVVPHLRRAIEVQRHYRRVTATAQASLEILDGLPVGILLLDRRRRVLFANRYADVLLSKDQPATLLRHEHPPTASDSVARILADVLASAPGTPVSTRIRRPGRSTLSVTALPLGARSRSELPGAPEAAIFVSDPDIAPRIDVAALERAFTLTPAQARLTAELLAGRSLREIAQRSGLSLHTVRDRLKQVLERTDTQRQTELVSLVLRHPAVMRALPLDGSTSTPPKTPPRAIGT